MNLVFQYLAAAKYPESIRFIEFGPGKGTLIHDIMKTFNKFVEKLPSDQKRPKLKLHGEASHVLRKNNGNYYVIPKILWKPLEKDIIDQLQSGIMI